MDSSSDHHSSINSVLLLGHFETWEILRKQTMTLRNLAKNAGVKVFKCDKVKWGGSFGYKTDDYPNSSVCGFWSEEDCYISWLEARLGKKAAKAIIDLLEKTNA